MRLTMIDLSREKSADILRQIAILQEKENGRLQSLVRKLGKEISDLKGDDGEKQRVLESILRQLRAVDRDGTGSEKRSRDAADKKKDKEKQTGHGPTDQPNLPIEEVWVGLEEGDRGCEHCGGVACEWDGQSEDSELITVVRRSFKLVNVRRKKYRCSCTQTVLTAPAPPRLIEGGRYSLEFGAEVVSGKYAEGLPLTRQARIMGTDGLFVTSQSLWGVCEQVAKLLQPVYEAIRKEILSERVAGMDETSWRVGEKTRKRWTMWILESPNAAWLTIRDSRATAEAVDILGDWQGTLMADGYSVYGKLARDGPIRLAHCWSHVRRKFVEFEADQPKPCREIIDLIGELYLVERKAKESGASRDELAALRQAESARIIDRIHKWMLKTRGGLIDSSPLAKSIDYMGRRLDGLKVFLDDPAVPLDNNGAERGLRGPVVGRKIFYGTRSRRGTETAAVLYSIVETARRRGVDPRQYIVDALHAAIAGEVLLPTAG